MRLMPLLLIASSALLLAGCPKKPTTVPEAPPAAAPQDSGAAAGTEGQVGEARNLPDSGAGGSATSPPSGVATVIYFDFDRSEIRPEYASVIGAHAKHMVAFGATRVRLEGHTDERGSREYNIALGERRAQAVRRALMLQGAGDPQLTTVSYGEERPAVEGGDEAAYEKNRRVEIIYGH
ncbi:MAG: peptidoglycan-associated lipoprotein Pal [Steroidobacteraceae bacterium]